MTHVGLSLLSVLVVAGSVACGRSNEDTKLCKELRAKVAAEESVHAEHQRALKTGIIKALDSLPVAGTEGCQARGLNWMEATTVAGESFDVESIPAPFYLGKFSAGSMCGRLNPENVKNKIADLDREVQDIATGHRLHFFESERVGAKLLANKSYEPGSVKGKLLVWSYPEKKFICIADAYAESGAKLHTIKGGVKSSKDLDDHLTGVAVRQAIEGLKVIDHDAKAQAAPAIDAGSLALDAGP